MSGLVLIFAVLGYNAALIFVIGAFPDFPPVLAVAAATQLLIPFGRTTYDVIKGRKIDLALYLGMFGTSLLWLPIYLLAITRRTGFNGTWLVVDNVATWLAVALLISFSFAVGRRFQTAMRARQRTP